MGHASLDCDAHARHVGELVGVVLARKDSLTQVLADLVLVDVERRRKLDVVDVIATEIDVHQPGDEVVLLGVLVVLDTLDQRRCAVPYADDGNADFSQSGSFPSVMWTRSTMASRN